MVVLQESSHLGQDVEPPVVQDLSQVGHAAHVHLLSCDRKQNIYYYCTKKETVNNFYTVRKIWADLTESNDAGQQFLTES